MPDLRVPPAPAAAKRRGRWPSKGDPQQLRRLVSEQALASPSRAEQIAPYLRWFHETYGEQLLGVLFYGSCLSETTRKPDSTPDFFAVTRDGNIPRHSWPTRLLHRVVPPNSQSGAISESGEEHFFKYIHLDLRQLQAATAATPPDLFVAGRLSKRVALVYWRDAPTQQAIIDALTAALRTLAPLVCCQLSGEFDLDAFVLASLEISYLGEWRIESAGKVAALLNAAPEYYRALYRCLLDEQLRAGRVERSAADLYRARVSESDLAATAQLLRRSRFRGACRWPQYGLTVRHGLQIMIAKIERTHPEVRLSPGARRHPVLFALPTFLQLLRSGVIKTHPAS